MLQDWTQVLCSQRINPIQHCLQVRTLDRKRCAQFVSNIGSHRLTALLPFFQRSSHVIESLAQSRQLVFTTHPDTLGEIALRHLCSGARQFTDGAQQIECQQERQDQCQSTGN